MKRELHVNGLLFKIICTVIVGIVCLFILLGAINISVSKKVFVDNFAESQRKIFYQIDQEFYQFYGDMADIMATVSSNENLKDYFMKEQKNEVEEMSNLFFLDRQMRESKVTDYNQISLFVVGENEKSYLYSSSDVFSVSKSKIFESDVATIAKENPNKIICKYREAGFTNVMKRVPVVMMAKALSYEKGKVNAIAFITIKESDIGRVYQHFTSSTSDIILLNQDNEVISSDNSDYLTQKGAAFDEMKQAVATMAADGELSCEVREGQDIRTYLMQRLQSSNYKIVGIIDPNKAFMEQYGIGRLLFLTLLVTTVVVCLIAIFVRQQTRPLARLVDTMQNSRKTNFKGHVPIEGTYEVQELSVTYNRMVDELDKYIDQLMATEEEKRAAEIHALQMQINPHYMYNTLTSIKWLIWQGDAEKSTKVIDAFILLLRNSISNSDEFVPVEQEINNLKNYVLINQVRYGDAVDVEFFVMQQCRDYRIPKLILQPFVENAFFHAFPEGQRGSIQIFVKEDGENLRFDIVDDGVGMKTEQLTALLEEDKEERKSEHFTGIGIGNVEDRIRLIYGVDYGIHITSEEGKGTKITLVIPQKVRSSGRDE